MLLLAGLVTAGVAAMWLAGRLHVPSIVPLLGLGLLLGPVTGVLRPEEVFGDLLDPLVSLAVGIVLFEGGLSLRFVEARKLGWPLLALVVGGLVVSFSLTTFLGMTLAGLSWPTAAVIGAILVVTGPTVVKPMLRQARLQQRPANLLRWEGIVNDPFGALLAVLVIEVVLLRHELQGGSLVMPLATVVGKVGLAGLAGGALGKLLVVALGRGWIHEHLKSPVILSGVLLVFAGSEALFHEAGLLAVTVMGVVMANGSSPSLEAIRHFKETITTLLIALLFLVLSARLSYDDLTAITPGAVALVLAILFVVRPASVWLSLMGSGLPAKEKLLVGWIAPRGIVAAAMAGALTPNLVEAGYPDARVILPAIFGVILLTVLLHGFSVAPLARKLGLASRGRGGVLLVGLTSWSSDLARCLRDAGVDVLCLDENSRSVIQARLAGLEAAVGDVLVESSMDDLPLERFDWMLAATRDDTYNSLASVAMAPTVGTDHVLQLSAGSGGAKTERSEHLKGRMPWGASGTYGELAARYWGGKRFKSTQLTDEFDGEAFVAKNPGALVLFAVTSAGVKPVGEGGELPDGARVIYLP